MSIHTDPARRHDFVYVFDATNTNPNGDPDAGNLPRVDPESGRGLVTDVSLKRRIRDYVAACADFLPDLSDDRRARVKIYVEEGVALNGRHRAAFEALGKEQSKGTKGKADADARAWMCDNFFDVRMFGAVMSTGDFNCGQVIGPVQVEFAMSIDPVFAHDIAITRVAVTSEKELGDLAGGQGGKDREMGRKALLPYGCYVARGTYSPQRAIRNGRRSDGTGADAHDLELLWQALVNMWDVGLTASKAGMATRALHVFTHTNVLGDAPRHSLYERINIERNPDVAVARSFGDYTVRVDGTELGSVTHTQIV